MFPIDLAKLPALKTRRGLVIVDPQNDFLAEDGVLAVRNPEDLLRRLVDLATAFRQKGGDVIWVHSQFEKARPPHSEQIVTSDGPVLTGKGHRSREQPQGIEVSKCPEAFLGPEAATRPKCVRVGSSGIELHPAVQQAVQPKDHLVVKSYYSAFKSEQFLRLLRMRLVTELFICGSLTNIGVMATAIDAASHGYSIAIVEDCCGYRSSMRHSNALENISEATGCDIVSAKGALEIFQPKPKPSSKPAQRPSQKPGQKSSRAEGRDSTVRRRPEVEDAASLDSELESSFGKLTLNSEPAVAGPDYYPSTGDSKRPIPPAIGPSDEAKEKGKEKGKETQKTPTDNSVTQSDSIDPSAPPPQHSPENESEPDDASATEPAASAAAAPAGESTKRTRENSSEERRSDIGPTRLSTDKVGSPSTKGKRKMHN